MNITCSRCFEPFSITADQLGTRGKCPHCRATIILPKSAKDGQHYDAGRLEPPSYATQSVLCGFVTFLFHASALVVIAMVPWGDFSDELPGDGTLVMIGKLPKNIALDQTRDELEAEDFLNPESEQTFEHLETELFSPTDKGEVAQQSLQDLAFSSSSGSEQNFDFNSLNDTTLLAGGTEDFSALVSRLKREGLDIVITFDSTGSMQGEIDQVKSQVHRIGSALFELIEKTQIGICTYRDIGDEYVVDGLPLTDNLTKLVLYLEKIQAAGGGDEPEAVEEGLGWAANQKFRRSARKVILLFGDAPPRPSKSVACQQIAAEFRKRGGVVSTVTCRNSRKMDDFVKIAESGSGEAFLTTNEKQIMAQLVVLVFGSKHRSKVIEAFDLLEPNDP